jgi:hypothetical protein
VRRRCATPSYLLLGAGFFVCGFHVAFLAVHLPGVVAACGLPPQWGGWALAMLGLFNIIGSLAVGWASAAGAEVAAVADLRGARAGRAGVPVRAQDRPVVLVFAAVMGLTYLSTVPPTAGLVAKFFGPPTWRRCSAWSC